MAQDLAATVVIWHDTRVVLSGISHEYFANAKTVVLTARFPLTGRIPRPFLEGASDTMRGGACQASSTNHRAWYALD
jgi:hypothetical protein